jgi:hypothetical protein
MLMTYFVTQFHQLCIGEVSFAFLKYEAWSYKNNEQDATM